MAMQLSIVSDSETQTHAIAARLAGKVKSGDCILLRGDLGAGKTTFARGFIRALCDTQEEIVSPTFTLAQTYDMRTGGTVWHFDLYRLKSPEEVWEIGLEDALLTGISLIEWPEMAGSHLPADAMEVHISHGPVESQRVFLFKGIMQL